MDGLKARLSQSLQFQLSAWLSGAVIVLALVAGAYSFWSSFEEANELQDDQLRQVAALISRHDLRIDGPGEGAPIQTLDPDLRVVVQLLPEHAAPASAGQARADLAADAATLALPKGLPDGLQTVRVTDESWRLLVRPLRNGQRFAVGQLTDARDEIALHGALRTVLPLLLLIPGLALVVALVVRQGLRPVVRLATALDQRTEFDLSPLPQTQLPSEIRPFTTAIGALLQRLAQAMTAQRRFVADAAHELRSPLTALSLQAEALADGELPPKAQAQLVRLRQGIQRARALIDQLLTLARSQAEPAQPVGPVSAPAVLRRVIEDLMPLAEHRQLDLGVTRQDSLSLQMSEIDLYTLMRNLVDNAIRYSPPGEPIDVSLRCEGGIGLFEVSNGGAGITPDERERVFSPFYRVLGTDTEGSGLGLAIVKTLVERVGGSITLQAAAPESTAPGLRVVVRFPRAVVSNERRPCGDPKTKEMA